ncbi:MAG TPA: SDR family oxidoreductase [Anaerolineales bacterium]|nr:SDR family oxidoreductase [Anaerolineales bacterium]
MNAQRNVAIVTGAASGIGKSVAELYAQSGAAVVISDIDQKDGEQAVEEIRQAGGEATFVKTDVAQPAECERMVSVALEQYGRLDYACNNAGIGGEANPTADYSVEGWQRVISINLSAVFYCMKYQIPAMLKNGGGAIVNMASILGQVGFAGSPAYVAAKHGVVGLTRSAALDYAQQGIRINAVGPAFISTPMIEAYEEDKALNDMLVSLHPMGRLGEPQEVAEMVFWLNSEKASFVTGGYYAVDGGYLAR